MTRKLKVYRKGIGSNETSQIRIQGNWLQSIGYQVGDYIEVECHENELTIRKLEKDEL